MRPARRQRNHRPPREVPPNQSRIRQSQILQNQTRRSRPPQASPVLPRLRAQLRNSANPSAVAYRLLGVRRFRVPIAVHLIDQVRGPNRMPLSSVHAGVVSAESPLNHLTPCSNLDVSNQLSTTTCKGSVTGSGFAAGVTPSIAAILSATASGSLNNSNAKIRK